MAHLVAKSSVEPPQLGDVREVAWVEGPEGGVEGDRVSGDRQIDLPAARARDRYQRDTGSSNGAAGCAASSATSYEPNRSFGCFTSGSTYTTPTVSLNIGSTTVS